MNCQIRQWPTRRSYATVHTSTPLIRDQRTYSSHPHHRDPPQQKLLTLLPEMWTDTYRTNVAQCFFMTTAFLPLLQKATEHQHGYSGTVINITSISGVVKTAQHHFAYNASKAAAIHLTTMLSNEIAMNGLKIRVNAIAPGVFPSEVQHPPFIHALSLLFLRVPPHSMLTSLCCR